METLAPPPTTPSIPVRRLGVLDGLEHSTRPGTPAAPGGDSAGMRNLAYQKKVTKEEEAEEEALADRIQRVSELTADMEG